MPRAVALSLTCVAMALTASACGQSAAGGVADPASLVPAAAPVYVQAAVQPQGQRRDDALAAAGKLMRTGDPAGRLRELVDTALAHTGGGLTWERDFAPWVGEEAGIWAADLQAGEPSWGVVVAARDTEAARTAIARIEQSGDSAFTHRSYKGLDYEVDADGAAVGVVDDFVVAGTEDAFKRSVDLRDGGESLAGADSFEQATDDLDEDRLGLFYLDTKTVMEAALREDPEAAQQLAPFRSVLRLDQLGPTAGSLQADGDGLALDAITRGLPDGAFRALAALSAGAGSDLIGDLPGDAWGAYAVPRLGEGARAVVSSFAGALGGAAVAAQFKQATGLDLEQDIFSWVGDAGVFVRGAGEPELDGALVVEATDDGKAAAAFGRIVGLIGKEGPARPEPIALEGAESAFELATPGAKPPIVLARGQGRVVAAYGETAAAAALDPDTELGDSELYGDAQDGLGDDATPGFVLAMPAVLRLVDAIGETDPEYEQVKPYLEAIGAIAGGGSVDGDTAKSRLAVRLK